MVTGGNKKYSETVLYESNLVIVTEKTISYILS